MKQELSGLQQSRSFWGSFFPQRSNLPRQTTGAQQQAPSSLLKKVLPSPPALVALELFFPFPHFQSRLGWPGELLKHLPPCSKRYFPAPLPTFANPLIVFSPSPLPTGLSGADRVAALDARKNPGTKRPLAAVVSLERSRHRTAPGDRRISGKIPTQNGRQVVKVCWEESQIPNLEINFDFQ